MSVTIKYEISTSFFFNTLSNLSVFIALEQKKKKFRRKEK